nr:PREDICTED: uncharacterized protein LOC107831069 [Nicotiana tabacum]
MTFKDIKEARRAVNFYALANRRGLQVIKTDSTRASYKCATDCPFRCYISQDGNSDSYQMKTWKDVYTCHHCFKNPRVDQNTLAHLFKRKVSYNPQYSLKEMKDDLETGFELNVSMSKLKRGKNLALKKLEGSFVDDYKKLEAYGQELRQSNPGTDVVINISKDVLEEGKRKFLRMYICFNALKMDWKDGLRLFIGLDGTFLMGRYKGQLLVAIGQDNMNHFYPLAWVVVDKMLELEDGLSSF